MAAPAFDAAALLFDAAAAVGRYEAALAVGLQLLGPAPAFVFAAAVLVSTADVVEPRAYADIAPAFAALVPVFVVAGWAGSSARPRLFSSPNNGFYASLL